VRREHGLTIGRQAKALDAVLSGCDSIEVVVYE